MLISIISLLQLIDGAGLVGLTKTYHITNHVGYKSMPKYFIYIKLEDSAFLEN